MYSTEKNAAILFADIVDSSRLYSELGDAQAQPTVLQGLELLSDIVVQSGGQVVKTIGDEVLAVFDSATHGAEAALFMQKMFGATKFGPGQHALNIRVGLHWGAVIRKDGDVFGNTVNTAARIVAQAKPKQILVSQNVLQDLSGELPIGTRLIDTMKLKGIQDAVEVHEIFSDEDEASQTMTLANEISESFETAALAAVLTLKFDKMNFHIGPDNPTLKLGRDETNHVIIDQTCTSRFHARIEYDKGRFTLTDQSTNGTYVKQSDGTAAHVHRDKFILNGQGLIVLGQPIAAAAQTKLSFRITPIS